MSRRYTLYGAEFSMFSAKLRAYLRHKRVPFDEVAPSVLTYRRFIVPRTGVAFIPVLQTPADEVLQDTTAIIDRMEAMHPLPALVPRDGVARVASLLLELFGDEWMLLPAMRYRWMPAENLPVLRQAFGDLLFPWFPRPLRRWLGQRATARFAGALGPLGLTAISDDAFDAWYALLLGDIEAIVEEQPYLLGSRATLADFSFAGPFHAHLMHDPAPARHLRERYPAVVAWIERVMNPPAGDGADAEPTMARKLLPLLERALGEQVPVLRDAATHLAHWAEARYPGDRVPRSVGRHAATIAGVRTERAIMTYPVWMLQRVCDAWQALDSDVRRTLQADLEVDVARLLAPLPVRLDRKDNRLELADG